MRNIIAGIIAIVSVVSPLVTPVWAQRGPGGVKPGGSNQPQQQQQQAPKNNPPPQNNTPRGNPNGGSTYTPPKQNPQNNNTYTPPKQNPQNNDTYTPPKQNPQNVTGNPVQSTPRPNGSNGGVKPVDGVPVQNNPKGNGVVVKPPVSVKPVVVNEPVKGGGANTSTPVQSMPRPANLTATQVLVTPKGNPAVSTPRPNHYASNQAITASELPTAQLTNNTTIVNNTINNTTIINNITNNYYNETNVNQYYWHNHNGYNYCHYYDSYYHWYGWYYNDYYYWTVWHNNYFWMYDSSYARWVYYHNGYWWYNHPQTQVVYIYVDNSYYQYQTTQTGTVVMQPEQGTSGNMAGQRLYYSKDGTRLVKIDADAHAFLYNTAADPVTEIGYLASFVKDVEFSDPLAGALEIYLTIEKMINGAAVKSKKTFNAWGQAYGVVPAGSTGSIDSPVGKGLGETTAMKELESGSLSW